MNEYRNAKRRIGIIGGSFDPVHAGHLIVAQDAFERLELNEIIFVPAAIPPHKQHLSQTDGEHRFNMLNLAVETDLRFSVSTAEIDRGGVSYTVDTLEMFRAMYPSADLFLIVGSDTVVDMHTWKDLDRILELCEVSAFLRPGEDCADGIAEKLLALSVPTQKRLMQYLVEAHRIEISSTEIRMRLAEGLSIRYLVPPEVEMYICEHGLYQG